jgi:cob(I)alamin adenosyltransferase
VPRRKKALHELAGSGDDGTTALLGGGRAPKDDLQVEAYGTVDEASSALGLAKALTADDRVREVVEELQRELYRLGAELAVRQDEPRAEARFATTSPDAVRRLEALMAELESQVTMPAGFVLPGSTPASGALDLARAVVRRAERRCVSLARAGRLANPEVARYLNRLSLLIFVLGRFEEARAGRRAAPARQG